MPTVPSFSLQDSAERQYPQNDTQRYADRPRAESASPSKQKNPQQEGCQEPEVQKVARMIFGEAEQNAYFEQWRPISTSWEGVYGISEDMSNDVKCQVVDRFVAP